MLWPTKSFYQFQISSTKWDKSHPRLSWGGVLWASLPPAPLWLFKGKPRVSQLWEKLSSAPEWNTNSYPPIYPIHSSRCSCGSAFTDLWLVFEPSRRKQLFLQEHRVSAPCSAVSWVPTLWGLLGEHSTKGWHQHPAGNFPNPGMGGISSWWRAGLRWLLHKHQREALDETQAVSLHPVHLSQCCLCVSPMWVLPHPRWGIGIPKKAQGAPGLAQTSPLLWDLPEPSATGLRRSS